MILKYKVDRDVEVDMSSRSQGQRSISNMQLLENVVTLINHERKVGY